MKKKYNTWRQNRKRYGSDAGVLRIKEIDETELLVDIVSKELRHSLKSLGEKGKRTILKDIGIDFEVHDDRQSNFFISFDYGNV